MLFALICTDRPGSLDLRMATRPQHLAFLETYQAKLVHAGALADIDGRPCGSLLVIDVGDRAQAEGCGRAYADQRGHHARAHYSHAKDSYIAGPSMAVRIPNRGERRRHDHGRAGAEVRANQRHVNPICSTG